MRAGNTLFAEIMQTFEARKAFVFFEDIDFLCETAFSCILKSSISFNWFYIFYILLKKIKYKWEKKSPKNQWNKLYLQNQNVWKKVKCVNRK